VHYYWHAVCLAMVVGLGLIFYRCLAWSLDSPVLRRAWRHRRFGWGIKGGIAAASTASLYLLHVLGADPFTPATFFFGGMFLLLASAGVLFCSFLVQDVHELFRYFLRPRNVRLDMLQVEARAEEPELDGEFLWPAAHCPAQREQEESRCVRQPRRCSATWELAPSRHVDWRPTRQHR